MLRRDRGGYERSDCGCLPRRLDRRICEHGDQALGRSRVGDDRVAQRGVGQTPQHRNLHGGHDFARFRAQHRKAQDLIVGADQRFGEPASLRKPLRVRRNSDIGCLISRYEMPFSACASDSVRPTCASSGSMNKQ